MTDKRSMLRDFSLESGSLTDLVGNFHERMKSLMGDEFAELAEAAENLEENIDEHLEILDEDDDEDDEEGDGNVLADYDLWLLYRSALNIENVWDPDIGEDIPMLVISNRQYVPVKRPHVHQHGMADIERIVLNLYLYHEGDVDDSSNMTMEAMQEAIRVSETPDEDDDEGRESYWEGRTAPGQHLERDGEAA